MRKLIKFSFIALIVATISLPASAQTFDGARFDDAIKRMNVAPAQEEQVRMIIIDGFTERLKILQVAGFEAGKKPSLQQLLKVRDPIKTSRKNTEAALSTLLSAQQVNTYRQIMEESRANLRDYLVKKHK